MAPFLSAVRFPPSFAHQLPPRGVDLLNALYRFAFLFFSLMYFSYLCYRRGLGKDFYLTLLALPLSGAGDGRVQDW
jgi:hypothetical protein